MASVPAPTEGVASIRPRGSRHRLVVGLYDLPSWISSTVVITAVVVTSIAGLFLVRSFVSVHDAEPNNEVAGFIYAGLGVLYAMVLAFIAIWVWERFSNAEELVEKEASSLAALFRQSEMFGPETQARFHQQILLYTRAAVEDEWRSMARGEPSELTQDRVDALWQCLQELKANTPEEVNWHQLMLKSMDDAMTYRRLRLSKSQTVVPGIVWAVLIIGGIITVSYSYLYGVESLLAHSLMTGALAAMVGLILIVVLDMDTPFSGSLSVHPEPLLRVMAYFQDRIDRAATGDGTARPARVVNTSV